MVLKFLMGVDTYTGNFRYAIDMCMGMSGEATTSRDITLSFSIGRKEARVLLVAVREIRSMFVMESRSNFVEEN